MFALAPSMKRMARAALLVVAVTAIAPLAWAAGGDNVTETVLHHVVDGDDIAFQNPITGATATIKLPKIETGLTVFGKPFDLSITRHLVFMWFSSFLLIVGVNIAVRRRSLVPRGFYSFVEVLVAFVRDELAVKNIGKEHADRYVPFLCTAFFLILTMNVLGLVPYSATATGNIAVTAGLALCTFAMTLFAGMRGQGVAGFWLNIVPQGVPLWLYPIMVPVELLGLLTKPFALAVRLFANMSAGHIIIGFLLALIFMLGQAAAPVVAPVSVAFAAGIYLLKLFVAFLQAYIFTMLSALFIGMASHPH